MPVNDSAVLIIGANGQIGTALRAQYPNAVAVDADELDITSRSAVEAFDWQGIEVIINAAAYTNVDGGETADGRVLAWSINADGVANLVAAAAHHDATLIHISSDYVFDGTQKPHDEDEAYSPLSVYGASKAAGDIAVSLAPKFYLLRTTWVIGEGKNFVRTMLGLAEKGISPTVVNDQVGRITFATEIARAIDHLLTTGAPFGAYNATNDGPVASWADFTRTIFELADHPELTVTNTTTEKYFAGKEGIAPRPLESEMNLAKLRGTGFVSRDWQDDLKEYIAKELSS
jgi:dTDP-4-dehydrorhamnose 3,5-epimerase/reductase